jgi:hypothetical protein
MEDLSDIQGTAWRQKYQSSRLWMLLFMLFDFAVGGVLKPNGVERQNLRMKVFLLFRRFMKLC